MPKYVWKNGEFRDPLTGEAMSIPERSGVCAPQVVPDTPAYTSPVTGQVIEGRAARREDLKRSGCVDAGDMKPKQFRSEAFARRHGFKI